jgi:hypothetical protein
MLTHESTGTENSAETDLQGQLRLSSLPPGEYKVSITSPGFARFQAEHISLPARKAPKFQLNLAAMMGEIKEIPPMVLQGSTISDHLVEPPNSIPTDFSMGVAVAKDTRNPIRKFFSRLRRTF